MDNKLERILTSYKTPFKTSVIGNEAVARAAMEAGVNGVFSYPGTPSTEISEIFNHVFSFRLNRPGKEADKVQKPYIYFEYSINEKVAIEKAIAFSIGNKASMCVMKNVGLNIASDPLMTITYQTIVAPLVIVVCDDPGCYSSSNEQDSRHWGEMASVPVFNPATPADAYDFTKSAFSLSEQLKLPVILRLTTRVSHSRGVVFYNELPTNRRNSSFERLPEHINIPAKTTSAHNKLLDKLADSLIETFFSKCNRTLVNGSKRDKAIISSGVATAYSLEILKTRHIDDITLLDMGLIYPVPEKDIYNFLALGFNEILVLEELDPIIQNAIMIVAQKNGLNCKITGKGCYGLSNTGEYNLNIVGEAIKQLSGEDSTYPLKPKLPEVEQFTKELPSRPPALCAGCPHRATFYALKLALPRDIASPVEENDANPVLCGDIGCFGLGAMPPLKMIDTINHMGMSISMAQGLAEAFNNDDKPGRKTIALLGDGTFFHSGITSLINATYTGANILVIIFDNRTIGMTGHQEHPGATRNKNHNQIDINKLIKGIGVSYVENMDPFDIRDSYKKINEAFAVSGVSVLISKSPCVFLPEFMRSNKNDESIRKKVVIDPSKCNSCHNHADHGLVCSRKVSPQGNLIRAKAKIAAEISIPGEKQLCPANICNHGFLYSVKEGDYGTALEMVRDKMLFARTCGNICHRPCELFSGMGTDAVPIKAIKKYVSSIEKNFKDFSQIWQRVESAPPKGKKVIIVGAGPAGLSAAYDLRQWGYEVKIIEKETTAGGLIKHVIPDFRMDKTGFDFEVAQLLELGVEFLFNTALGRDVSLSELSDEYDAVLLSLGMSKAKRLPTLTGTVPDDHLTDAVSFLRDFNKGLTSFDKEAAILVIGGGNSAIDAARAANKINERNRVILSCIESREDMPAFEEEIIQAGKEGIEIISDSFVHNCKTIEGNQIQVHLNQYSSKKALQKLIISDVIVAIGQEGDEMLYKEFQDNQLDNEQRIKSDEKTGFSNYKNIFVAGDICADNHLSIIGAIGSGKRAANGIRKMLENYEYDYEGLDALLNLRNNKKPGTSSTEFELKNLTEYLDRFNLFQACYQCNHCIDNFGCPAMIKKDGKVHIDESKCTNCGLCIDVCPNDAIHWSTISKVGSA